jgi:hypothetical protein
MNTSSPSILVIQSQIFTMANPAAFVVLLTYTCSTFLFLPRGQSWGSHAFSPVQKCQFPLQRKLSIVNTGCWHIEINQTPQQSADIFQKNTSARSQSSWHLQPTKTAEVTVAGLSDDTANAAPSSISISSSFYIINVGTGTPITTSQPNSLTWPGSASTTIAL